MAAGSKATLCPAMASTAVRPSCEAFVRQHGLADHVADGVNRGIVGLQLLVYLNESARADLNLSLVQAGNFGIRLASHRHQNFVEDLFALLDLRAVEGHADAVGFLFHRGNGGVEQDGIENLFYPLVQRKNQVAVRAGQQSGQHFDHGNFRAQRGVHRAQLQADVAAADHQQRSRHLAQIQSGGGIHDARACRV